MHRLPILPAGASAPVTKVFSGWQNAAVRDGFEPLKAALKALDAALMGEVETAMGNRSRIATGTTAEVESAANSLFSLFDRVG